MTVFFSPKKSVLAVSAVIAFSLTALSPVYGLDKDTFMNRLQVATSSLPYKLSLKNLDINGNSVVLRNVVATPKINDKIEENTNSNDNKVTLGDIYFDNITEEDTRYIVDKVRFSDITKNNSKDSFSIKGISLNKLILNDQKSELNILGLYYQDMNIASASYSLKGNVLLELNGLESHYDSFDKKAPINFSSKIDSFTFNPKATQDLSIIKIFQEIGIETIKGRAYTSGIWDILGDGRLNIQDSVITAENIGTLKTNLSLSGFTTAWFKAMDDLQTKEKSDDSSDEKNAFAFLALTEQIKMKNAKLRYEDAGITNKIIDFQAKQKGMEPSELKDLIKSLSPLLAMQLQSLTFSKELIIAIKTFIDNPQSIEITVNPEEEVSMATLGIAASLSLKTTAKIIEILNMHIIANN